MNRKLILLMVVCLLAPTVLLSCQNISPPDDTVVSTPAGTVQTEAPDSTDQTTGQGEQKEMLVIAENGKTSYKIINGVSSLTSNYAVRTFSDNMKTRTGAEFSVVSGTEPVSETEIIIGNVAERAESAEAYRELSYSAYSVRIVGRKIVVSGYTEYFIEKALKLLGEAMVKDENGAWCIDAAWSSGSDETKISDEIPKFSGNLTGVQSAGSGNYEVSFSGVKTADYDSYLAKLVADGYTLYSGNDIAGNKSAVYLKNKTQVYVAFYPTKGDMKLVYGAKEWLPSTEKPEYEALVTPSVTQIGRKGADESSPNGAPGMSYIIQVSDGSFIIIDGGPANESDEENLLAFLREKTPGTGKPRIAAWIFSHAHNDHTGLAVNFINNYRDDIIIEMMAANFPDFNTVSGTHEDLTGMGREAGSLQRLMAVYYKNADILNFHTGQKFWICDAEIEIIYTQEDYFPNLIHYGNDTSCAFRITLGGKTMVFLCDCDPILCQYMADVYGDWLRSDMLQLAHHGYNGAVIDLYKAIDPDICFWASDEYRFNNDRRCLGTASGYEFNAWIRDDSIKVRQHYHCSTTTTLTLAQ